MEYSKEMMYNSVKGLKRVNEEIPLQKAHVTRSVLSSDINREKGIQDM